MKLNEIYCWKWCHFELIILWARDKTLVGLLWLAVSPPILYSSRCSVWHHIYLLCCCCCCCWDRYWLINKTVWRACDGSSPRAVDEQVLMAWLRCLPHTSPRPAYTSQSLQVLLTLRTALFVLMSADVSSCMLQWQQVWSIAYIYYRPIYYIFSVKLWSINRIL